VNIKDIPRALLDTVSSILLEKKTVKEVESDESINEDNMDLVKKALKGAKQILKTTTGGSVTIDSPTASAIMTILKEVKPDAKKKIEKYFNDGDKARILKVIELAFKHSPKLKKLAQRLKKFEKLDPKSGVEEARDILFPDGEQIPIGIGPKADTELLGWIRKRVRSKPGDKKYIEKLLKHYFRNRPKKLNLLKAFWDGFSEGVDEEQRDDTPAGVARRKELASWLRKRLGKARPADFGIRKDLVKLLKKLEEGVDEAGPRWIPDDPSDRIPIGFGPKADTELVVWLKKRLKANKPGDKKYVEKLLKKLNVLKSFRKKFYEGADKDEEVDLDEKTKWKMGDGRPRGGSHIENVRFWDLPKDSLQYIIKDAGEAIKANPTGRKASSGPGNYADQVNDASTVLGWRKKNGIKEEVELDEAKPEFEVKYAKSKGAPIKVAKFMTLDQAKEFLDDVKKDGMNGIISKGGKPVKEEVDLDEGVDKDVKGDKEAYQKFFQGMLKKFGVKSPAELSGDKKKEFYDAIDAGWKADDEKKESADKDVKGDKEAYQKFFQGMLKKFGVKSPAELSGDKKKEFYNAIDAGWKADDEKKESVEESRIKAFGSGYKLYHDTFSDAMQHAYDYAKKKLGVTVDPNEIDRYVALGPKKPSKGKTNSYRLKGTGRSKGLSIQVYNTGKSYELNMYAESVDEDIMSEAIEYEIKNGKIYISKKDFAKVHKDYKNTQKGKERMSVMEPKTRGTVSMEVVFEDVYAESVDLDEWTLSDVEIAMINKYGKVDKKAIEKLRKVMSRGNVVRNDLVKVGHGKLHVDPFNFSAYIRR
jgi:hypothetical protein